MVGWQNGRNAIYYKGEPGKERLPILGPKKRDERK